MATTGSNQTMDAVRTFIREELVNGRLEKFDEKTDFIEQGVIDSLSLIRLVSFLEQNCQIMVPDEDIVPDNFRTLAAIESFVAARQAAQSAKQMGA